MNRAIPFLCALALSAAPLLAQDALAADPAAGALPLGAAPSGDAAVPDDPVAAWAADPGVALRAEGLDLGAFEYVARPLIVFADDPAQPQFIEQMRLIEAEIDDLARRDVVVIVDSDPAARSGVRLALRPRGFGLVLLDKDGRVALRQPAPTSVRELARAIDRTPIRQEELRNGRGAAEAG